jgi:TolB-like protein
VEFNAAGIPAVEHGSAARQIPLMTVPESSLAVLPLDNVSGDPADDHLCRGVVADLISNLCRFRNLTIIARHSAFLVSSNVSSLRDIGNRLGVRYLLTGSFRRVGKHLRVAVDLIEAETENTIWSERYDGTIANVFGFQDSVTAATASRLSVHIDLVREAAALRPETLTFTLMASSLGARNSVSSSGQKVIGMPGGFTSWRAKLIRNTAEATPLCHAPLTWSGATTGRAIPKPR